MLVAMLLAMLVAMLLAMLVAMLLAMRVTMLFVVSSAPRGRKQRYSRQLANWKNI
jgi:hypothetical protein